MNTTIIQKLNDDSQMPFGKYAGVYMIDIPASYLHYLWAKGNLSKVKVESIPKGEHQIDGYMVAMYIRDSISALKEETPDLIW